MSWACLRAAAPLALALVLGSACVDPDRRAGLYVEHPGLWGADMVALHHGTFSDGDRNIRMRTELIVEGGLLAVHLEYPTSGKRNRDLEGVIEEHAAFIQRYMLQNPAAKVTLVGFSQGGCVQLDMLTRLATREPSLLARMYVALIAPARSVKLGKGLGLSKRMSTRCAEAEAALEAMMVAEPEGAVAELFGERAVLTWSCNDKVVGHDSFDTLQARIPAQRVLYRRRHGHVPWASKAQTASDSSAAIYGESVELASAIARAMAEGRDPRTAVGVYGGFEDGCG
ncbi:hypothetical protein G6O69_28960 [Pseudenhygromyxa sp. WMMC2535]|uniref:hypothetical protein n=1 Tax=Pseudenhygromyxa sp. WMMC2535 TaxID=2712867 RepID=UPI001553E2C9|nr:hypothetical protein [Pseudenhygromyxa sp. WMMC2535]NVB41896.1 hypothetical protein [Pseudenhygromyxa sp. WMMC2535]